MNSTEETERSDLDSLSNLLDLEEEEDTNDEKVTQNLTKNQVEKVEKQLEEELRECRERQLAIKQEKDILEFKLLKSPMEEERLEGIKQLLKEEEVYAEELMTRISYFKSMLHRRGAVFETAFSVSNLPQVILCSPWDDDLMPKVVVCDRPKELKLHPGFRQCFTPEQMAIIADEKRWMAVECGKLQLQIAGLKGQVRVVTQENNMLKAIIEEEGGLDQEEDTVQVKLPCTNRQVCPGVTGPCPKYKKQKTKTQKLGELSVSVSSLPVGQKEVAESLPIDIRKGVNGLKDTVDDLQRRLDKVRDEDSVTMVQELALRCCKQNINT